MTSRGGGKGKRTDRWPPSQQCPHRLPTSLILLFYTRHFCCAPRPGSINLSLYDF